MFRRIVLIALCLDQIKLLWEIIRILMWCSLFVYIPSWGLLIIWAPTLEIIHVSPSTANNTCTNLSKDELHWVLFSILIPLRYHFRCWCCIVSFVYLFWELAILTLHSSNDRERKMSFMRAIKESGIPGIGLQESRDNIMQWLYTESHNYWSRRSWFEKCLLWQPCMRWSCVRPLKQEL